MTDVQEPFGLEGYPTVLKSDTSSVRDKEVEGRQSEICLIKRFGTEEVDSTINEGSMSF